jgi:hypothetical protein
MFGAMSQGFGTPPQNAPIAPAPAQNQSASGMAIAALICGIGAWVAAGPLLSIPGWILGKMELNRIARGESPEAGKQFAQIGYWASMIYTILFIVGMCAAVALMLAGVFFAASVEPPRSY